jgi:predicted  nucleic acid-binding Zn-ribbon protein
MPVQATELLQLQELDSRIDALTRERAALDNGTALKQAYEAIEAALVEAQERLHNHQANQVNAELELRGVEEKRATVSRKLYEGKVTNPKELSAMAQEIEMFGRQRGRLDERILVLMDEIETTTAEVERLTSERDAAKQAWEEQVARARRDLARINAELKQLTPQRAAQATEIDPNTLRRYEGLRQRANGLAAVRIVEGHCTGCRTSIPTLTAREVEARQRYSFCENCGRFLL